MLNKVCWLIHKDLVIEYRTRLAWPTMLLLGTVVAVVFSLQMDWLPEHRPAVASGILWLAVLFAGLIPIERNCAAEQPDGCWDGLVLYPLTPAMIYLAKLVVNVMALLLLMWILIPLFIVLSDVPLLRHPWAMLLVAMLGSIGLAAIGTLVSVLAMGLRQRGAVLSLLVIPLVVPIMLAAAEATRLVAENDLGELWWRWVRLLGACAVVFITLGVVLFGFLVEE